MTAFPKYPSYKPSGVEWLGDVPEHWEVNALRACAALNVERNRPDLPVLSVYREYGVILKDSRDDNHNATSLDTSNYKVVHPGDLAVNKMKAWQGSLGVSEHHGIVSPAYITCKVNQSKVAGRYLHYLLRSKPLIGALDAISYGVRVGQWDMRFEDFKQVSLTYPPRAEQDRIVAFLDEKTAEIDRLIGKKQRQIELLDEQKAILINRAVTRGLHPQAELQDSGIPWIGPIPKHWKVVQLKRCIREQEYGLSDPATDQGAYTYLGMGQIQDMAAIPDGANRLDKCPSNLLLRDKDILFNRTNSFDLVGKAGIYRAAQFEFSNTITFASYLVRLRTSAIADPEWLNLLLGDASFLAEARSLALRSLNQANLTFSRLGQTYVPLPPANEQLEIVNWTNSCFAKIATATAAIDRQIQTLQTLRATLTAHAVTGKIKVA